MKNDFERFYKNNYIYSLCKLEYNYNNHFFLFLAFSAAF